ncbi:MAG: hypothetical protein M3336_02770 [Chloroflexota bacterium]|nr:hypothetical protein [Chloroflexota bacterium]
MVVPPYCRSRGGRVFRITRLSEELGPERMRYVLRATPIRGAAHAEGMEASREIDTALMRDMIARGQVVPTPEETFEQLWQQLRLDLDA